MKLKNVLIAVKDMEQSRKFYKDLFGLEVILDNAGTMILTEGLVLQDASLWRKSIEKDILPKNHGGELYFEEADIEAFIKKLESCFPDAEYVTPFMTYPWGQKVIRFYDPDGNLIEVRTPMENGKVKTETDMTDSEGNAKSNMESNIEDKAEYNTEDKAEDHAEDYAEYHVKAKEENKAEDKEYLEWEEISVDHVIQDEWIDFRRSAYRFPDGKIFEPFYSYSRKDYVVIVASDVNGQYLCVRQFRQGIRKVTTEFPAGGIERTDGKEYGTGYDRGLSENALQAARRELLEETGYVSERWNYLLTVPSNATMADNYAHIFMAEHCHKLGGQNLDETEFLNIRTYSPEEIDEMIQKGNFEQAIHIMAWLMVKQKS